MDNTNSEYEKFFISADENELSEHLKNCQKCQAEHFVMQKVSALIAEVKPYYIRKRHNLRKLRAVAVFFLVVFCTTAFGMLYNNEDLADALMYGQTLTAEDYGFPVDSYGLLMVD